MGNVQAQESGGDASGGVQFVDALEPLRKLDVETARRLLDKYLDLDLDFGIPQEDLQRLFRECDLELGGEVVKAVFDCFPKAQASKTLNALDFLEGCAVLCNGATSIKLDLMYDIFDFQKRGEISFDELTIMFMCAAEGVIHMGGVEDKARFSDATDEVVAQMIRNDFGFQPGAERDIPKEHYLAWAKEKVPRDFANASQVAAFLHGQDISTVAVKATEIPHEQPEAKAAEVDDAMGENKVPAEGEAITEGEATTLTADEGEAKAGAEDETKAGAEDETKAGAEDEAKAAAEDEAKAAAEDEAKAAAEDEAKAVAEGEVTSPVEGEVAANGGEVGEGKTDDTADPGAEAALQEEKVPAETDAVAPEEATVEDTAADAKETAADPEATTQEDVAAVEEVYEAAEPGAAAEEAEVKDDALPDDAAATDEADATDESTAAEATGEASAAAAHEDAATEAADGDGQEDEYAGSEEVKDIAKDEAAGEEDAPRAAGDVEESQPAAQDDPAPIESAPAVGLQSENSEKPAEPAAEIDAPSVAAE